MIITNINCWILEKELISSMRISRGGFTIRKHFIVQIETDSSISGLGEGVGDVEAIYGIIKYSYAKKLIGEDPTNINKILQTLHNNVYFETGGSTLSAISALEIACWDIKAKALYLPVYDLLGGKIKNKLEVYASNIYIDSRAKMIEGVKNAIESGYENIKIHLGDKEPENTIQFLQYLDKWAVGAAQFMIDLNCGYNLIEAAEFARLIKPLNIKWLEEPTTKSFLTSISGQSEIPIAAGENETTSLGFKTLFDKNAIDVAMPDIGRVGGILETKKICALAESYGVTVSPHNYASGILLAATIHLMASTENTYLLEMDNSNNSIYRELLTFEIGIKNGYLEVPDCFGLGVQLPEKIIQNYASNIS